MKRREFVTTVVAGIACPSLMGCKSNEKTIDTGYGGKLRRKELYDPKKYGVREWGVGGFLSHSLASLIVISMRDKTIKREDIVGHVLIEPFAWSDPIYDNLQSSIMWKIGAYHKQSTSTVIQEAVYFNKQFIHPEQAYSVSVNTAFFMRKIWAGEIKPIENSSIGVQVDDSNNYLSNWEKPTSIEITRWWPNKIGGIQWGNWDNSMLTKGVKHV